MLIKLNKVPKCPATMELEGRAAYLDGSGGGLVLGLSFDKPRSDIASALRGLVASRTSAIPSSLPAKTRRRPEPAPQEPRSAPEPVSPAAAAPAARPAETPASANPAPATPASAPPASTPAAAAPGAIAPAGAASAAAPEAAPAPAATRNDPILRLRKRSRAVVALATSPVTADLLKEHLQDEGYGRVLATGLPRDLFDFLQQPNLGILLIDGNMGPLDGLALVNQLRGQFSALPPIVLAVEDASTAIVLAARRAGVAHVLVKPYSLDAAFTELLDQLI
jgi:CheY-like chemotaxis protein